MSLATGQRLGPYEIVGPLGAGGMGEVFVARDTRLGREVAVKVLPRDLASDPERRARFEREARAISALSHPNVCALFDVGQAEGPDGVIEYLVMEKLEGETLAARLTRGPLPAGEVLALGGQLAGALAAAHRRGIVHRDVKPGNVMLTRSGAKLLDFGLARHGESEPGAPSGEEMTATLATAAQPLSRVGTVMGTWPYLAPEQVRGRPADARSDVFALGAVLHEALTARRAFPGAAPSEIAAAILEAEPADVREAAPGAPPGLAALVRQCLAKDPDARWQCADDVAHGLRLVEEALARPAAEPGKAPWPRWAVAFGAAGLVVALAAGLLAALRPRPAQPLRFAVAPPAGVLLPRPTLGTPIAVSPDGRRIAFMATTGGVPGLWLWSAEDGRSRPLEGTAGATAPFFSPDGREIAFFAQDELRRVPVEGGPAIAVAPAPLGSTGTWGPDGTVLFARAYGPEAGLWSVPARGGEARNREPAASLGDVRFFPRFLPDGRHYLYLSGSGGPAADRRLCVAALDGGDPDCFAACHSQGEYSPSGHVLCLRSGTLVALPFDARRRKATGEAVPLEKDARWFGPTGAGSFAVSGDGRTLVHEPRPAPSRLAWLDGNGREIAAVGESRAYGLVRLAPDGRRAAVDIWDAEGRGRDVWSLDTTSGVLDRLTFDPVDAWAPAWSPRGGPHRLCEGRGRAARRDGAPSGRQPPRGDDPQRPRSPVSPGLVARRRAHRRRGLLAVAPRPAPGLAHHAGRPRPPARPLAGRRLSPPLLPGRAEDRVRLRGVRAARGLHPRPRGRATGAAGVARGRAAPPVGGATAASSSSSSPTG